MYVKVDGVDYWVEIYGEGEPVVLLHGFTGSIANWGYLIKRLKQEYKVLAIDLPGHGQTKIDTVVKMEAFCQHLREILLQHGVKQTAMVGYSLGGRTALSFAMIYPEMVRSLVLESASPGLSTVTEQIERQTKDDALALKIESEGIASFVAFWENIPLFNSQKQLSATQQAKIKKERLAQCASGLAFSLRGMGTGVMPSWWDKLPTLNSNVLLIVGELDEKFVSIAKRMSGKMRNCQLIVVPNTGHAVHVEDPDFFGTIVNEFLQNGGN
ncbi:2-succinyl-6-hydroxy-2,4-cyclohexadiene-1-carboxylate synthase [Aquibacillus salsiterrae]|uniref:Putative 2-succinyl-6-hydroxy-2,4-cyclohexadiene-1-carboxylate synthase n=1 Tax=Aquibacillus salsiterrae TaxID=2950439 RepID=A0A9X4AHJ9_9BACI|nr:2-succinyl-6-hydroxy-2,4-cyclohexadiene-1-carboxylate synthase [Aquibacillus salsiterrae]MDC3418283.1 2-succinyl-6-hydroxy-2,4-cyclohexadiene-1-carboxylate synthase [Aquibacillus salsiterrae]